MDFVDNHQYKAILYKQFIQFRQAETPSRYDPRSKYRFRALTKGLE